MTTFLKNPLLSLLAGSLLFFTASCKDDEKGLPSCDGVEYEYDAATEFGPQHWGELCVDWTPCSGKVQSPINIVGAVDDATLSSIPQTYAATATHIVNKGHTIQFNFDAGSSIVVDGLTYDLLQFHTHTHSEHEVDGHTTPMEMHFVHKNTATGKLAVIGVLVEEGAENAILEHFVHSLPATVDATFDATDTFNATDLMPSDKSYFTYAGSLTTPPCSEIVTWIVMEHPIEASLDQIEHFEHLEHENARPVQALEGRVIKHHKG